METQRLRLEPLAPVHARELEAFARLREVARYTAEVPHPYPAGGALVFVDSVLQARRDGGGHVYAVVEKGGDMVGCTSLDLSADRRRGELGYIFAPWSWGRGLATEAARAMIDASFDRLGLDAVVAHAAAEDRASCRVLAKAGLRRIGDGSFWAPARGRRFTAELYRLTRRERSS
jgi:RimJ/RimL family protein N-acetyltransferase